MTDSLGNRLKLIRGDINQDELAILLGVSNASILCYEQDDDIPDVNFLLKICELLSVNLTWLLKGEGSPKGDDDILKDVAKSVEDIFFKYGAKLPPDKKMELISLLYDEILERESEKG